LRLYFQLTGYKPFVEACIDAGQKTEALKYIPKLTDPRERSEVFFSLQVVYGECIWTSGEAVAVFFFLIMLFYLASTLRKMRGQQKFSY